MPESRIQILRGGTWPSSAGLIEIDERIMSDVVTSYNPTLYRAPLVVTHRLPAGHTERTLPWAADLSEDGLGLSETQQAPAYTFTPNGLAYGAPKRLERRADGGVDAVFDRISPCFVSWVRNGNLLSVSPGLYRPTDVGNPTPGKWSLKHVAGLGSEPPASKGMQPLALTEHFGNFLNAQKMAGSAIALSGQKTGNGISVYHSSSGIVPPVGVALTEARRLALWSS